MELIDSLASLSSISAASKGVGTLMGNFDGVHLGHQKIIEEIKARLHQEEKKLCIFTFVPHPTAVIKGKKERFLISSYEERRELLADLGVDYLVEQEFTRDFSNLDPALFLDRFLLGCSSLSHIFVGHDFCFGKDRKGDFDFIKKYCSDKHINVEKMGEFRTGEVLISSSLIRKELSKGVVEKAKKYLGKEFVLTGRVIKGDGRGKSLGFPTANIQIPIEKLIPAKGVYGTRTFFKDAVFESITNIGVKPTFGEQEEICVETNIFNFDQDIYGHTIKVEFHFRVRDEIKFTGVEQLVDQITLDKKSVKKYFTQENHF